MLNLISIKFEAVNAAANVFREYFIYIGKDLFGAWLLTTAYGRIGKGCQVKTYSFSSLNDVEKQLRQIVSKRIHSEKRIGVAYKVIDCDFPKEMPLFAEVTRMLNNSSPFHQW